MMIFLTSVVLAENTPYWWGRYGVLLKDKASGDAIASIGHIKHLVTKTSLYFKDAYPSGSAEVTAMMNEPWFIDSSNDREALTVGRLRDVATVIFDEVALNGADRLEHTKWIVDASPFFSPKQLKSGAVMKGPIQSDGVIYPWAPKFASERSKTPVTMNRLKFTFAFELPFSRDKGVEKKVIPKGTPHQEYKFYRPLDLGEGRLPLVVYLTGDGGYVGNAARFSRNGHYRSYVLTFKNATNSNIDFMIERIEDTIRNEKVDPRRIYIKSFSRGGVALMDLLNRRPDLITVAWFVDPGVSQLGLRDNPFRDRSWSAGSPTPQQVVFAKKLKANGVYVILSPAQKQGNRSVWTRAEMRAFYRLFSQYGVRVKYSVLPGSHGASNGHALRDFRYWTYMFQCRK